MKIGNFDIKIGRVILPFVLVGTIATCIALAPKLLNLGNNVGNDISRGYYTDEDVKANKRRLFSSIETGGREKPKTYSKNRVEVPKKLDK